jgi:O-antigen ligase
MVSLRDLRIAALAALVMSPLLISINPTVANLGSNLIYMFVWALIGVSTIYVLLIGRIRGLHALGWSIFWLVCLIVWSLIRVGSGDGWVLILQWVGLLLFFCAVAVWPLSPRELDRLTLVGCTATLLAVCLSIFGPYEGVGEGGVYTRVSWFIHSNYLGGLLDIYAFFVLLGLSSPKKPTRLVSVITLAVLLVGLAWSASRAAILAMLIVMSVTFFWHLYSRRSALIVWSYIAVATLALSLFAGSLMVSPQALPQPGDLNSQALNTYSLQLTGKPTDTGREEMWAGLFTYIEQRPLFGWGAGVVPEDFTGIPLSAHNGFLQIWLQLGIVGLLLQIALLTAVGLWLFRKRHNRVSRVALAVFLALIVRDMFEVALIQNNAPLTTLAWLVIGVGVSAEHVVYQSQPSLPASGRRKATMGVRR